MVRPLLVVEENCQLSTSATWSQVPTGGLVKKFTFWRDTHTDTQTHRHTWTHTDTHGRTHTDIHTNTHRQTHTRTEINVQIKKTHLFVFNIKATTNTICRICIFAKY